MKLPELGNNYLSSEVGKTVSAERGEHQLQNNESIESLDEGI